MFETAAAHSQSNWWVFALVSLAIAVPGIALGVRSYRRESGWGLWGAVALIVVAALPGGIAHDGYKPYSYKHEVCHYSRDGQYYIGRLVEMRPRHYYCNAQPVSSDVVP